MDEPGAGRAAPGPPGGGAPDAAAIRRALAECMTLADIDEAMGWRQGTARRRRWLDLDEGGLPPADAELGGMPLWFRGTVTRWRSARTASRQGPVVPPQRSVPPEPLAADRPDDESRDDGHSADETDQVGGIDEPPGAGDDERGGEDGDEDRDGAVDEANGEADDGSVMDDGEGGDEPAGPAAPQPGPDTAEEPAGVADEATVAAGRAVRTGFELRLGQSVLAHLRRQWRWAVVRAVGRDTALVDYELEGDRLGPRRQRIGIDKVLVPAPPP